MSVAALNEATALAASLVAQKLSLKYLPLHFQTILLSLLGFQALELLSGPLSARLLGTRYTSLKRSTRHAWSERIVSLAHALVVVPLAIQTKFLSPERAVLVQDKAFGWTADAGRLFGISVGYFIWDTIRELRNFTDFGFIAHGATCLAIYTNAFRPFLVYYGSAFLLWEASTPLLNFHWFFDKLGMTGSLPQLINGILLLATFLLVRIIYGGFLSWEFYGTMQLIKDEISPTQYYAYLCGNSLLNLLNWLWFYKMIRALRKRFDPATGSTTIDSRTSQSKPANGQGVRNGKGKPAGTEARRRHAD